MLDYASAHLILTAGPIERIINRMIDIMIPGSLYLTAWN